MSEYAPTTPPDYVDEDVVRIESNEEESFVFRLVKIFDTFLYAKYGAGGPSDTDCDSKNRTFPVEWFEPNEYSRAQEEIHHVFGICVGAMVILWLLHIIDKAFKSFVLQWSGRVLTFMGAFLLLWLGFLMSPRNAGLKLWNYVLSDYQQRQHIALALVFLASGRAETVSGDILVLEKKTGNVSAARSRTRFSLVLLHMTWGFHFCCAGVLFLFHPQIHPNHLAMHRILGASVFVGGFSFSVSKILETLTNTSERLRSYPLTILPQVCFLGVFQLLLFFPHHGASLHVGFEPICQPRWLRNVLCVSATTAIGSLVGSAWIGSYWYRTLRRNRRTKRNRAAYQLTPLNEPSDSEVEEEDDPLLWGD